MNAWVAVDGTIFPFSADSHRGEPVAADSDHRGRFGRAPQIVVDAAAERLEVLTCGALPGQVESFIDAVNRRGVDEAGPPLGGMSIPQITDRLSLRMVIRDGGGMLPR